MSEDLGVTRVGPCTLVRNRWTSAFSTSTRLSSIFEQNEPELDEVDNILSNIKQEAFEKLEENAKSNAELSLDKETLIENKPKYGKKLSRELSNMLLQNLSF